MKHKISTKYLKKQGIMGHELIAKTDEEFSLLDAIYECVPTDPDMPIYGTYRGRVEGKTVRINLARHVK